MHIPNFLRSFLSGMAEALDIGGTMHPKIDINTDFDGFDADREALASDWKAIGDDMYAALHQERKDIK